MVWIEGAQNVMQGVYVRLGFIGNLPTSQPGVDWEHILVRQRKMYVC